jgi:hypothetical protein
VREHQGHRTRRALGNCALDEGLEHRMPSARARAHARRNFVEAMSTEPELAGEMIALIAELYGIE